MKMDLDKANQYLQDTKKVLDELNVPFFLFFGTLLGAIREGNFLAHDDDIDIGVFAKDVNSDMIDKIRDRFNDIDYSFYSNRLRDRTNMFYIQKGGDKGIKLDVCLLFDFEDKLWFPRYTHINKVPHYTTIPYSKKYFKDMKSIEFRGEKYLVPTPPEEFLVELWGDWRTPCLSGQYGIIPYVHFKPEEFKSKDL